MDQVLTLPDGRTVGYNDYGGPAGSVPVLYCHGGPGSRIQSRVFVEGAETHALRLIGIDRPGYGLSTTQPGRTIADWSPIAIAVADHLQVGRFLAVGVSTGGAYALSLASLYPTRVAGVALGCAMTDMSHPAASASMPLVPYVGCAPTRDASIAKAEERFGKDGAGGAGPFAGNPWSDYSWTTADLKAVVAAATADPALKEAMRAAQFANGVQGYVDDRRSDAGGWGSFDVAGVRCPVIICHGESDTLVPVLAAHHTHSLLPGVSELRLYPELGHLSMGEVTVQALADLVKRGSGLAPATA